MPHPVPTRTPLTALAVTAAVTALLASGVTVQDVWLAKSLETAIAAPQPSARASAAQPPVAGSESFWLTTAAAPIETLRPVSFAPVVALGTQVTLGAGAGLRQLEVVAVSELPAEAATSEQRLLVVTLRDKADRNANPVRLVLDADAAARLAATQPVADRAL